MWPPAHTKDRSIDLRSNDPCLYSGSLSHVGVLLLAPAPPLLLRAAPTARGACNAAGARLQRRCYTIQYNHTTCQINEEYSFILVSDIVSDIVSDLCPSRGGHVLRRRLPLLPAIRRRLIWRASRHAFTCRCRRRCRDSPLSRSGARKKPVKVVEVPSDSRGKSRGVCGFGREEWSRTWVVQ